MTCESSLMDEFDGNDQETDDELERWLAELAEALG